MPERKKLGFKISIETGPVKITIGFKEILILLSLLGIGGNSVKGHFADRFGFKQDQVITANDAYQDSMITELRADMFILKEYIKERAMIPVELKRHPSVSPEEVEEIAIGTFEKLEIKKEKILVKKFEEDSIRKARLYEDVGAVQMTIPNKSNTEVFRMEKYDLRIYKEERRELDSDNPDELIRIKELDKKIGEIEKQLEKEGKR